VEKQREGKCLGWKNDGREFVLGGKTTGGNNYVVGVKNDGREYVLEGICP